MSKFEVLGKELEYEFLDADELEKYQRENQRVVDDIEAVDYTKMSTPDGLREQCKIINTFFDNLFGAGTAESLFGGKNNIKTHMEAFAAITDAALESDQPLGQLTGRYSPNRAQRRFEDKNKRRQGQGNVVQYQNHVRPNKKGGNKGNGNRA